MSKGKNKERAGFCPKCGAELKRPGLNFFSVLAISGGSIGTISIIGGVIGTIVGLMYAFEGLQDDGSGLATFFAIIIVGLF